jgi:hypothetical protein
MNYEKRLCELFLENPEVNPETERPMGRYTQDYQDYIDLCFQLGYGKDIGELRAREQLRRAEERRRTEIGERKLPPRQTNSPEQIVRPVIRPIIPVPQRPAIAPLQPVFPTRSLVRPITDPNYFQKRQVYNYFPSEEEAEEEEEQIEEVEPEEEENYEYLDEEDYYL